MIFSLSLSAISVSRLRMQALETDPNRTPSEAVKLFKSEEHVRTCLCTAWKMRASLFARSP